MQPVKRLYDPNDGLCGNIFTLEALKAMANEFLRFSQLLNSENFPEFLTSEDLIGYARDCDAYAMGIKKYRYGLTQYHNGRFNAFGQYA